MTVQTDSVALPEGERRYVHAWGIHRIKRTVGLGIKSILSHGLRSLLTVLGTVFGVSSVIAMLAVGEGASHEAQEQIRQLGSTNIIIRSVKPVDIDMSQRMSRRGPGAVEYGITYQDLETIQKSLPAVVEVLPMRIVPKKVRHRTWELDCDIVGTVTGYPALRNYRVARGRFFTQSELNSRANVCVVGHEVAERLFPIDDPMGKTVMVGLDYYTVVGVMEQGGFSNTAQNEAGGVQASPHRIFIPLTTAKFRFGETLTKQASGSVERETIELHEATIRIQDQDAVIDSGEIVTQILDRRHKQDDFEVEVPLALLRQAEASARMFNIVLGAIAGISLLVGGIGIMNIMLASVTERTREIGIRRALGAKKRDIVVQFLVETVILSGLGGLIGVGLGIAVPFFITWFSDMQTVVTFWAPILAFSISAVVGIVFGIYPAMRAAEMDPVEALRHE